jgi:hypothetical protein
MLKRLRGPIGSQRLLLRKVIKRVGNSRKKVYAALEKM